MLLGGLWHGANWTFVVWGALHGIVLSIERMILGDHTKLVESAGIRRFFRQVLTFHVVCFSWIFFRAESISGALKMIRTLGHFQWSSGYSAAWLFLGVLVGLGLIMDLQMEYSGGEYVLQSQSAILGYCAAVAAMVLLIFFSASGTHAFIYFRF
jgi:hypothetical protein